MEELKYNPFNKILSVLNKLIMQTIDSLVTRTNSHYPQLKIQYNLGIFTRLYIHKSTNDPTTY